MDSMSQSRETSGDNDTQSDLKTVFKHPAGLQTARDLVELVFKHMFNKATHTPTNDTISSMPTNPESSPEVEGILRDILAFSDLQRQTSQQERLGDSSIDLMDIASDNSLQPVAAPSLTSNSSHQRTLQTESRSIEYNSLSHPKPTPFASSPSFTLESSVSRLSSSEKSPERDIRSMFGPRVMSNSLSQGIESPYRVESPAVRASTATSQFPSRRLTDRTPPEPALKDDSSLEQFRTLKSTLSIAPVVEGDGSVQFPGSSTDYSATRFTQIEGMSSAVHNSLPHTGLTSSQSSILSMRQSPTIKSFLPVNKSIGHNTSVNGDNRNSANNRNSPPSEQSSLTSSIASSQSKKPSSNNFFSSLRSPSPHSTLSATTQFEASQMIFDLSSPNNTDGEVDHSNHSMKLQKRKNKADGAPRSKKQKGENSPKRISKSKEPKPEPAKYRIGNDLWMRILEFTPPQFLSKARLISKTFKGLVDQFDSIYVNCRIENYGWDMPSPPKGLTERQYSDLFGGKGCLEPVCGDEKASRTHWSWAKRWCHDCWKGKIEREDRALKRYQSQYGRATLTKMFECIPVGMHDSFLKPHDYIEDVEARTRQAPRLYKYYLSSEIQQVINDYESLTPPPYTEDPNHTAAEKSAALAAHQTLMDALEDKRNEFFAAGKKANDDHMAKVQKIETAIRKKREENRTPYDVNRAARKELFLRRAQEEIPWIDSDFVKNTKAYKAATRIFRDPGTERGWQTLKPKIEKEWDDSRSLEITVKVDEVTAAGAMAAMDSAEDDPEPARSEQPSHGDVGANPFQRQTPIISDLRRSVMMQQQRRYPPPQPPFGLGSLATASPHYSTPMNYGNSMVHSTTGHPQYSTPLRRSPAQNFGGFMTPTSFNNPNSRNPGNSFPGNAFANSTNLYQHVAQPSSSNHANHTSFHNQSYQNSRHISINSLLTGPAPPPHYNQNPNHFG